ncbi:LuxR C-terminal-related transcriptional regulator [Yersinia enterocolitica]
MNYIQLKNGYSSLEVSDDRPKLQLSDMETQNTLKRNNHLIQSTKSFLIHVLDNILVEDKFIILSDETGAIINIISDPPIMQHFFECGFKLGTKMTIDSIGENALARSLISKNINISRPDQHQINFLKQWTEIGTPIIVNDDIVGAISIYIKFEEDISHCNLVIDLISRYISALLEKESLSKYKTDKTRFFGYLILNNEFGLTPKEIQILYELFRGEKLSSLPKKLFVSTNTIKTHLKNIYSKLNVKGYKECLSLIDGVIMDKLRNS